MLIQFFNIIEYDTQSVAGDLKGKYLLHIICTLSIRYHYCVYNIFCLIAESIEQMMRMQAASNITLRNVEKRLLKIESAIKQRTRSPDTINDNLIAPFLPLSSIEIIKEFDAFLKTSNETVVQFVSIKIFGTIVRR